MLNKVFLLVAALISGCATVPPLQQQWTLAGGSKADAIVEVGYEAILKEKQKIEASDSQALEEATKACKRWGYNTATPASTAIIPGVAIGGGASCLRYSTGLWGAYCSLAKAGKRFQCS